MGTKKTKEVTIEFDNYKQNLIRNILNSGYKGCVGHIVPYRILDRPGCMLVISQIDAWYGLISGSIIETSILLKLYSDENEEYYFPIKDFIRNNLSSCKSIMLDNKEYLVFPESMFSINIKLEDIASMYYQRYIGTLTTCRVAPLFSSYVSKMREAALIE